MPTLLIVGCGYLGRQLAHHFAHTGWQVTAWTSTPASAERASSSDFRVSPVDIRDLEWVRRIGERDGPYDWIINSVSSGGGDADNYREIYLNGTAHLIRALTFGRILYTGSTSVYGQIDGSEVHENTPTETTTATGRILLDTEQLILARGGIVTRLAGLYGPERNALLRRFRNGEATLDGDGTRWLNTIHRDDAARAIQQLIESNHPSEIVNIADNGGITQLAAYRYLSQRLQLPLPPSAAPNPNRKRGLSNKQVSNHKLRALGWCPAYPTLLDGLASALPALA